MRHPLACLLLAARLFAPSLALAFGPPAGDTATATNTATLTPAKALETINKAAHAQGDISPLTVKALQNDPKAMEAIGRAPSGTPPPQGAQGQQGKKTTKAIYGDIIIHK